MSKRLLSLRTAVLVPFIGIVVVIVVAVMFLWRFDYNWMVNEQASKILNALDENTKQRINFMLTEPLRINEIFSDAVSKNEYASQKDLKGLEDYTLNLAKKLKNEIPQISVISYGDEKQRFLGYRKNSDGTYSLMAKDERTKGLLNIYKGEAMNSEILGSYKDYDPTQRPWYAPVKKNPVSQWSDIYINQDEQMEATISSIVPIFDTKKKFTGVADIDVKLNGINEFLKKDSTRGKGSIYIVDKNWKIIAHSGNESAYKIKADKSAEMLIAVKSTNSQISLSSSYIQKNKMPLDKYFQIDINNEVYYCLYSKLDQPKGLDWNVVVVVQENDLMGAVRDRQNFTFVISGILLILAVLLGFFVLNRVIKPILLSAKAAENIEIGNWEINLDSKMLHLAETNAFITAFGTMTERLKESFDTLQLSEEKYRSLIENVDEMIYSITPNGNFFSVNESMLKKLNMTKDMLIGKPLTEAFKIEAHKIFWKEKFQEVIEAGEKASFKFSYEDNEGIRRTQYVNLLPLFNKENKLQMVLGFNSDVSELIHAQEEIERLHSIEKTTLEEMVKERTEELEIAMNELVEKEKLASLGSLVSGISHEINTPLGVAISAASYMESISESANKALQEGTMTKSSFVNLMSNMDESILIINTNLQRAASLILSFKEIAVNQNIEEKAKFNIYEYIQTILLSLKHELKNTRHTIDIKCDPELVIYSYAGAFSQIITNLIMNSLKHAFEEEDKGSIEIVFERMDDKLRFEYRDNGKGIPQENLKRIFEPFFTTTRGHGGSGLGLNIVYNLVTGKLRGKIQCDSEVNVGTSFIIEIPEDDRRE